MNKKFLISLMSLILVVTILSSIPVACASRTRKICFVLGQNPTALFDGDVDLVWVAKVKSAYGVFMMAFYKDSDDDGTHWYTENLGAGDIYASLTEAVYSYPTESVVLSQIDLILEENYLKAIIKVSGAPVFTAEFWVDENARVERFVESPPNDTDGFFSFSFRRPLTDTQVSNLIVGSFTSGYYDYLDIELYDSTLLP